MKEGIFAKLLMVQQKLKAPKDQYNSFGKYKYRSAESILEAVKPLLMEHGLVMVLTDTIEQFGDRLFLKATVTVTDGEEGKVSTTALAEIATEKKGMDVSQITGTASSYARKYALNGMFLIDDTKDADTDEYQNQKANASLMETVGTKTISAAKAKALQKMLDDANVNVPVLLDRFGAESVEKLTEEQHSKIVNMLAKKK